MTPSDDIMERLKAANPVPSVTALVPTMADATEFLAIVKEADTAADAAPTSGLLNGRIGPGLPGTPPQRGDDEERGDDLRFVVFSQSDEGTSPIGRRRWVGIAAAVAASIIVVAGVAAVADRTREDVEPVPAVSPSVADLSPQDQSPSVDEPTASPDVTDAAAAPSVTDPVSLYRWSLVPDSDGAFAFAGVFEPGFGDNDPEGYTEHANRIMASVTVGGPGLVAVGTSGIAGSPTDNHDAAVWTSDDGIIWTPVPDIGSALDGFEQMASVTAGGPGLVAVGSDRSKSFSEDGFDKELWTLERAAVWTSVDGMTWSRVAHDESVFGGLGDGRMNSVTVGGPGLVAVGTQANIVPEPGSPNESDDNDLDAAVWTSVDGMTWSRVPHDDSIFGGAGPQTMSSVTAGGPGLVAVGTDGLNVTAGGPGLGVIGTDELNNTADAAVWTSVDGITWSRLPDDAVVLGGANAQHMTSVTTGGPGLVAVGYDGVWEKVPYLEESDPPEWTFVGGAAVWTSVDGSTWAQVSNDAAVFGGASFVGTGIAGLSQYMNSVTTGGPGLVAVGTERPEGTNDFRAVVWTSVDGITWSRVPDDQTVFGGTDTQWTTNDDGPPSRRGTEMTSVTTWGPALVAVGHDRTNTFPFRGPSDAEVWIATPL